MSRKENTFTNTRTNYINNLIAVPCQYDRQLLTSVQNCFVAQDRCRKWRKADHIVYPIHSWSNSQSIHWQFSQSQQEPALFHPIERVPQYYIFAGILIKYPQPLTSTCTLVRFGWNLRIIFTMTNMNDHSLIAFFGVIINNQRHDMGYKMIYNEFKILLVPLEP